METPVRMIHANSRKCQSHWPDPLTFRCARFYREGKSVAAATQRRSLERVESRVHHKDRTNERLPPKHCGTSCRLFSILSFHPGKTQRQISAAPVFRGVGRLARQMGRSRCWSANEFGRPRRLMGKKNTGESQLSDFLDKNGHTPDVRSALAGSAGRDRRKSPLSKIAFGDGSHNPPRPPNIHWVWTAGKPACFTHRIFPASGQLPMVSVIVSQDIFADRHLRQPGRIGRNGP